MIFIKKTSLYTGKKSLKLFISSIALNPILNMCKGLLKYSKGEVALDDAQQIFVV